MKKFLAFGSTLLILANTAQAATPTPVSYRTTHYRCDGGQKVSIKQVNVDKADFMVVHYRNQQYALAPAISASGIRYVGLSGLSMNTGLEWVEWHGKGYLNSFPVSSPENTQKVLDNCKALR